MNRTSSNLMGVLACLVAVAIPISACLYFAKQYIQEQELQRLNGLAGEVMRRSEETRTQIYAAADALKSLGVPPCSEQSIARMREIDVASSYLQAVGYVEGERLMCSSLGSHGAGIPLGRASPRRASGVGGWIGIKLPIVPSNLVNIYERDGFVSIVHPDLVTDLMDRGPELTLGLYLMNPVMLIRKRGEFKEQWMRNYERDTVFVEGDSLVAVRVNKTRYTAAIAAAPVYLVTTRVRELVWILVPLGVVSGLLMAFAVFYVARQMTSIQASLRTALKKHEFFLHYQPLVDLRTGECLGAEALIRWQRRDGSMIRPDIFIPAAEESGLIRQITARVMQMVAHDTADLLKRFPHLHIAINLSSADLQSEETVTLLKDLMRNAGIQPANLMVEATERGFLRTDLARPIVKAIRSLGIQVAIDDFGTGYSSLSTLESFELDYLKIDKSFVDTLGTEAPTSQVALHIIEMAKSLRLASIAEGVELQSQADFLIERGVQYAQGWLYGKPMPIAEFTAYLRARQRAGG